MRTLGLLLLLVAPLACAADGTVSTNELSIDGIAIDLSPEQVTKKLGKPLRVVVKAGDFADTHYHYPSVQVFFSENVVAGLYSDHPRGCTPTGLCPGDGLDKMRSMYGPPIVAERDTGLFYEYVAPDASCWLQISAEGNQIAAIAVACQP